MEVPVGVDALIVCYRRFFASVKVHFLAAIFLSSQTIFIAILNGIRLDNAAILRIDDNVCASITGFHRQDNKEKSSKLRLKKPL